MLARWWRRHARDADCGTVTAEFAVVLPCVAAVAILVLCLGPGCGGSDRRAARQRRGQGNSVFLIAMFMTACCP